VDDGRAEPVEVVDRLADALLVAGDRRRADHDRVAGTIFMRGWSRTASRESADIGSPCEPVVMITTSFGRILVDLLEPDHALLRDVRGSRVRVE
jgi:hypothetical protein